MPSPGVAIGAEELHGTITKLIEMANDHATRVDALERETRLVADGVGTLGRHCQSAVSDIRSQLATSVSDLGMAMQAIDAALRATVEAAQLRKRVSRSANETRGS